MTFFEARLRKKEDKFFDPSCCSGPNRFQGNSKTEGTAQVFLSLLSGTLRPFLEGLTVEITSHGLRKQLIVYSLPACNVVGLALFKIVHDQFEKTKVALRLGSVHSLLTCILEALAQVNTLLDQFVETVEALWWNNLFVLLAALWWCSLLVRAVSAVLLRRDLCVQWQQLFWVVTELHLSVVNGKPALLAVRHVARTLLSESRLFRRRHLSSLTPRLSHIHCRFLCILRWCPIRVVRTVRVT